jgi:hypothetical protein
MPQHAVTKGYEKREYFLAHASALSRVVVRKPDWSGMENIFKSLLYAGGYTAKPSLPVYLRMV